MALQFAPQILTSAILQRFGFDPKLFTALKERFSRGEFTPENNWLKAEISPPLPQDIVSWPNTSSPVFQKWQELGDQSFKKREVALVLLNGGMATRFGHKVKGVCEVLPDLSFLGVQLKRLNKDTDVFLLNSFATLEATEQHLKAHQFFGLDPQKIHLLTQNISIRLTEKGDIFYDKQNEPSYYAPGHGDVFEVLAASQAFKNFVAQGGKTVMIANVDNVAASLSAVVLGAHLLSGKKVTVEVALRDAHDVGGAPVRIHNRLAILEHFRFPKTFDYQQIPVLNTNTLWVNVDVMQTQHPLTWFRADKIVEGVKVVQFERLMGEITSFIDSQFIQVPREGIDNRFLPVKTPEDLPKARDYLMQTTTP